MKKICINTVFLLSMLILASCAKEPKAGTLYSGEPNLFSFNANSIQLKMTGKALQIPISRTSSEGEAVAPVTLSAGGKGYTDVFTIPSKVTFKDGEASTFVNVAYSDLSKIVPSALSLSYTNFQVNVGLAYPFTLVIDSKAKSPSAVAKVDVSCSNALVFKKWGTAMIASPWAGEVVGDGKDADGNPTPNDPPLLLEKAEGVEVYRIYSPYGNKSIAFMVQPDGVSVTFPTQVIDVHSKYGDVSMSPPDGKDKIVGKFVKPNQIKVDISYTVSAGSFGDFTEVYLLIPDGPK